MIENREGQVLPEREHKPRYRIMITRHAERLPSGELSPEGIANAARKGETLTGAEVVKAYASDHASGRAFDTVDVISRESGSHQPGSDVAYVTRRVPDIQYDIFKPGGVYDWLMPAAKGRIEEATLAAIEADDPALSQAIEAYATTNPSVRSKQSSKGESIVDIEALPKHLQRSIASYRQRQQYLGFRFLLDTPEAVHREAMGLAHQLVEKQRLIDRYARQRDRANHPPSADIVLNVGTHGTFIEAILKEAGILIRANGEDLHGITDFEGEEFGGYIQPVESIYLELENPQRFPDRIPVTFEGARRPQDRIFIDRTKLEQLNRDYNEFRQQYQRSVEGL